MAQLVAHLHGMQGVRGSNPLRSTKIKSRNLRGFGTFVFGSKHLVGSDGF